MNRAALRILLAALASTPVLASAADVRALGERMVIDHTGVNRTASELAAKLKLTPEPNATSAALKREGNENLHRLSSLHGAEFDKAYVAHEVQYHQEVIDAVDKTLLPNAKNAELRAPIAQVRPALVSHLEHARYLQASLSGTQKP